MNGFAALQRTQELDARVAREIARQDTFSTYGKDRDMEDELRETLQAFQAEKHPIEGRTWTQTQAELVQTLAVGLRLLRDIDSPPPWAPCPTCPDPDGCFVRDRCARDGVPVPDTRRLGILNTPRAQIAPASDDPSRSETTVFGFPALLDTNVPPGTVRATSAICRTPDNTCPRPADCNRAGCCQWETWAAVNPPRTGTI